MGINPVIWTSHTYIMIYEYALDRQKTSYPGDHVLLSSESFPAHSDILGPGTTEDLHVVSNPELAAWLLYVHEVLRWWCLVAGPCRFTKCCTVR